MAKRDLDWPRFRRVAASGKSKFVTEKEARNVLGNEDVDSLIEGACSGVMDSGVDRTHDWFYPYTKEDAARDAAPKLLEALKTMIAQHGLKLVKEVFENCPCLGCYEARLAIAEGEGRR